jgi:prenyltransferase/squalene oxidase-like repeat protein
MSWPLACFALVAGVLGVGWLAYERSRPSARMVAVVATLAALAALGRDAFVALPDVKPITAMTLVVGYALGPLAGFSVGALGMLASNVLLGQGPYTPWQMAAWGVVGLSGAALAALSGRSLNRAGLAVACGVAALGAKEIMNVYTWTVGASHTPAAFVAIAGTALPFDLTDVVASVLFGLAFAPELARLLGRVRVRMQVQWQPAAPSQAVTSAARRATAPSERAIPPLLLAAAIAAGLQLASPAPARAARLDAEVSFLARAQNSDGGLGAAPGQRSDELYTAWAAMGLAAAGRTPASVRRGGRSPCDYLRARAASLSGLGDAERTILAIHACGGSAYSFAGRNLVATVLGARGADRSFGHQANLTAFAIFALRAVGHSSHFRPIGDAAGWLERQQNRDGGFGFGTRGGPSDVDDTAAALQALAVARARNARVLALAYSYLVRSQGLDGGFPQRYGQASNAQSTAWAVQGLIAAGLNPAKIHRRGSRSPLGYLQSLVSPGGAVRYSRTSTQTPVWVTAQALIAQAGRIFPV